MTPIICDKSFVTRQAANQGNPVRLGFIGTGIITTAIVSGVCRNCGECHKIYISPRNKKRAATLQEQFQNVTTCVSNQAVLDQSDFVFLAVMPQHAESIVESLAFTPSHTLLSLLPGIPLKEIKRWNKSVKTVVKIVLTTFITEYGGPIAFFPYYPHLEEMFLQLGMNVIGVDGEKQLEIMRVQTALTASLFVLFRNVVAWAEKNGLPEEIESRFLSKYLTGIFSKMSDTAANDIKALSEGMHSSGMNAKFLSLIGERGGFTPWIDALEKMLLSTPLPSDSAN